MSAIVEITRGGHVESRHRVHLAVAEAGGGLVTHGGEPHLPTFFRSAAKPLQALPLVEDGVLEALGWSDTELALCCASHGGEQAHVDRAGAMLERLGLGEDALACGAHAPAHAPAARRLAEAGERPRPLHNNCSGKHVGMLALALHHGWPTAGYHTPEHPVQRRMLSEVARWTGIESSRVETGVDGCGVVCFRVPLDAMASSFARFAAAAHTGEGPARVVRAMTGVPWMVAGTERLCTDLMIATSGVLFAKTGAEGVYCAGVPERGLGIALKVEDGSRRAADVALLAALAALGLLEPRAWESLERHRDPPVRNTRGDVVGEVRVRLPFGTPTG